MVLAVLKSSQGGQFSLFLPGNISFLAKNTIFATDLTIFKIKILDMKRVIVGMMMVALFTVSTSVNAQEITDDQLKKYALLEQVIDFMKKDISVEVNKLIKAQEGMTGARYVELAKTKGDEAKLAELGAKDYEISFLKLVDDLKAERTESIKMVNQELATKMLGENGKVYKRIKAQLKEDADLKAKYEEIKSSVSL